MRKLTLKSYLEKEMVNLSGINSKSLYRFSALSRKNARLKDTVELYLVLFVKDDLKSHLLKKYPFLKTGCEMLDGLTQENIEEFLSDKSLSAYKTIYNNYLNRITLHENENKLKQIMHEKIVLQQKKKSISNYAIYKNLNLNPGNTNAFLKNGDASKLSLSVVRRILEYVNKARE